jgi:Fe/S biogenesis protein NfuA
MDNYFFVSHVLVELIVVYGIMTTTKNTTKVINISSDALGFVKEVLSEEENPESLALFIEVVGQTLRGFDYDLYFSQLSDAKANDSVLDYEGLKVVVPEGSIEYLIGATLDLTEGELVLINPNKPKVEGMPEDLETDSDLAKKVAMVLDNEINPAIASHGGKASLVGLKGSVVYLELSGGCQGCGMARMTLSQGIEVAIKEAVPEITGVIDVTDHASGRNPYFV